MRESKRFKVTKRQKQSFIDLNYQRELTIEEAFEHQKIKNHSLKQKNQKLQVKCKLLSDHLSFSKQRPQQIVNGLNDQILELDQKIKQLQEQLYFRYSKQMLKLKKKVKNFFQFINFQIEDDDLEQISDEIDLILFLMQVFQVKYDELTNQNFETFELIQKLRQSEPISGTAEKIKQLQEEVGYYMKENNHLKNLVKDYERELMYYKSIMEEQKHVELLNQNGEPIQRIKANQKCKAQISELESQKKFKDMQFQKRNKKISDLENELEITNKKMRVVIDEFEKYKREDAKWKERYVQMEEQKNQRIRILQLELNRRIGNHNPDDSSIGFSFKDL